MEQFGSGLETLQILERGGTGVSGEVVELVVSRPYRFWRGVGQAFPKVERPVVSRPYRFWRGVGQQCPT